MQLLVKYEGQYPPEVWSETGGERLSRSLWRFKLDRGADLDQLLESIARVTDTQTLQDALALPLEGDDSDKLLAVLESAMPFNTLYARQRYPWMLTALEQRLEVHFQPVIDMQAGGQIYGYEALCRLRDPEGTLLNGTEAFTLARQLRRQDDMDLACQYLALKRKSQGIPPGLPLFLNVMPSTLLHESWKDQCLAWLAEFSIDPREVVIEVVESERVDAAALADHCEALRALGLRIALDDMGAGFNGLATLAMVRAEFIKIDRSLVHEAQGSRVRAVLLEALVSMAERLGATVIAEGLERAEDVGFCQSMGLHLAQGYYFSPPAPDPHPHATPVRLPELDDAWRARPQDRFRLSDVVDSGAVVDLHAPMSEARTLFMANLSLPWLVVVDHGQPVGLLARGRALSRAARSIGSACDPIRRTLPNNTTLSALARSLYVSREGVEPWVVVGADGSYLGTVQPMTLISQILTHREHGANLHPLSQLPTGPSLRQTIESRLNSSQKLGLVYIDLDHFKAFNDRYGFIRGDAMIRTLAEILRHIFIGKPNQMLGHIGGDDFVLIVDDGATEELQSKLETAIVQFHALASHLYDPADLDRGYFATEDGKHHPIASVSVAVVNGSTGLLANSLVAAERAALLKKLGKAEWGSVIAVEGSPHRVHPVQTFGNLDIWRDNAFAALDSLVHQARGRDPHCLDAAFKAFPFFEMVFELDAKGLQRYPNWINPVMYGRIRAGGVGVDRSQQPYYTEVAETMKPYVSTIYLSTASEDFCLTLARPLFGPEGKLSGALVADLNLASMAALLDRPEQAA